MIDTKLSGPWPVTLSPLFEHFGSGGGQLTGTACEANYECTCSPWLVLIHGMYRLTILKLKYNYCKRIDFTVCHNLQLVSDLSRSKHEDFEICFVKNDG